MEIILGEIHCPTPTGKPIYSLHQINLYSHLKKNWALSKAIYLLPY